MLGKVVFSLKLVCSSCVRSLLSDTYDELDLFLILNAIYITAAKLNMTTTAIPRARATDELVSENMKKSIETENTRRAYVTRNRYLVKSVVDVESSYLQMSEFPMSIGEAIPRELTL